MYKTKIILMQREKGRERERGEREREGQTDFRHLFPNVFGPMVFMPEAKSAKRGMKLCGEIERAQRLRLT